MWRDQSDPVNVGPDVGNVACVADTCAAVGYYAMRGFCLVRNVGLLQ